MKVKRFGEKGDDKWYEFTDGRRVRCNEDMISALWYNWVTRESKRYYEDGYLVFEFEKPNSEQEDKLSVATEVPSSNADDTVEKENYEYERGNE